jgi:hypothetical protein
MSLAQQEFTDAGRSMLGRAQNGEILTITNIVVGDGSALTPSDLWPLTALIDLKYTVTISTRRDYGNGTLLVEGSFESNAISSAFYLKELGVMAHIGSEADRLYSVSNVFTDPPDYIDPAAPTIQAFKVNLVIERIPLTSLVIQIGPTDNVLGENVGADTVGPGPYKDAAGNVLQFKRFAAGPFISITEDSGENVITIGQNIIQTNVDLYVPTSNPNAPNPTVAFPTIQAAHDYLLQFTIPADKTATIHVYKGTFVSTGAILINHPNALQINIVGDPRVDKVCTSIGYINATAKRLIIADVTGLAAARIGYVAQAATPWTGGCQLIGTPHPSDVSASIEARDGRGNYTTTDTGPGRRFSYFPTVVQTTAAPSLIIPVFSCPNGIGRIENILATGGWAAFSLLEGTIKNCQAWGTTRGVNNAGGVVNLQGECVFTQCDFGMTGLGTIIAFDQTYINACTQGIAIPVSAVGSITGGMDSTVVYLARNTYAVNVVNGGRFEGGSILYAYNDTGFSVVGNSTAFIGNSAYGCAPQNNGTDVYAQGLSYVQYDRKGQPAPVCNPVAETPGNQGAIIHVLNSP